MAFASLRSDLFANNDRLIAIRKPASKRFDYVYLLVFVKLTTLNAVCIYTAVVFLLMNLFFLLQRNSISPGEREKYRTRSPAEPDHKKLKKEEKDMGHVS